MSFSRFYLPTRIYIGLGVLEKLANEANRLGQRGVIITGCKSAQRSGVLKQVYNLLTTHNHTIRVIEGIAPNPSLTSILSRVIEVKNTEPHYIVTIGGGAVIDSAKLISAQVCDDNFVSNIDWQLFTAPTPRRKLPLLCIPTTAGAGSEANNMTSFLDIKRNARLPVICDSFFPHASFIDPSLAIGLGAFETACGGVDMFCHVLEHYLTSKDNTLIEDRIAIATLSTILEVVKNAVNNGDNIDARMELARCSILAITDNLARGKGTSPVHRLEHAAAPIMQTAHGEGLALLLPAYLQYLATKCDSRLEKLGIELFGLSAGKINIMERTIRRIGEWLHEIGMQSGLGPHIIKSQSSPADLAMHCLEVFGANGILNPLSPLTYKEIHDIYQSAW